MAEAFYFFKRVLQDGLDRDVPWDEFDVLFIGGSTEWKLSERAYDFVAEAKSLGKWVHVGRVNSWRRYKAFSDAGADSCDGTFIAYGPDVNWERTLGWIGSRQSHKTLVQECRKESNHESG